MIEFFQDHTVRLVTMVSLILGIVSGCLGSFALLRRQSLLGDAIAHATLPGIALAFLITQSKHPLVILAGAAVAGWIGTICVMLITRNTQLKKDAGLGIILSVFFGWGMVLLTIVQRLPTASKAGLDKFLFGSAATMLQDDLWVIIGIGTVVLVLLVMFWKEFKIMTFDEGFAKSIGLPVKALEIFLTTLIVLGIVIGLQMVGVVLMSAMLVAPAAAARQWTDRLGVMVTLAALFGALSGASGAITSSLVDHLPTGPMIVLYVSVFVFISLLFAPNRGLFWDFMRSFQQRQNIRLKTVLRNLLLFSEAKTDPFHPHDISALRIINPGAVERAMRDLEKQTLVHRYPDGRWALTPKGLQQAQKLEREFLQTVEEGNHVA